VEPVRPGGPSGTLSNPDDALLALTGLLSVQLGRPTPTRIADPAVQRQRRLSCADICELVHRRPDGETIDFLADAFGIHRTTVMAHAARVRALQTDPRWSNQQCCELGPLETCLTEDRAECAGGELSVHRDDDDSAGFVLQFDVAAAPADLYEPDAPE
jgi:hypothetical protein